MTLTRGGARLLVLIVGLGLPARAEEAARPLPEPRNVVSVELPGFLARAVALNAERYLESFRWSVQLAVGARWAAEGDYRSWAVSLGAGVRWWFRVARLPLESTLGGLFAGARVDGTWVHVRPVFGSGELLGGAVSAGVRLGYRAVFWRHLEVTVEAGPALSMGLVAAPRLVGVPRLTGDVGVTVGYLF